MTRNRNKQVKVDPSAAWWRYGHVWMVIAGPLVVVVASVATYIIAVQTADGLVEKDPVVQSVPRPDAAGQVNPAMLPSLVGRNHAATTKSESVATP